MDDMETEVLDPTTSNEELMDAFNEIKSGGSETCEGNVSHKCVQDTVNMVGDLLGDRDDYVLIGGIPLQLKVLNHPQANSEDLMREFGSRRTNDIDIMTKNEQEYRSIFRNSDYSEEGHLDLDIVYPSLFPGEGENIIKQGETVHVEGYDIDAEIMMPTDTDLFYTKVHDKPSRQSTGTSHDAKYMARSSAIDIDGQELYKMVAGNKKAQDYVEEDLQF